MSGYNSDCPIHNSSEDLLNRDNFAKNLTAALLSDRADDCLTVSIEGKWGCGKTSIINLVRNWLSAHAKAPILIEYNPWMVGNAETLVQDFLVQFASQIESFDGAESGKSAANELLAYSKIFSVLKFIPGAEPWASIAENVANNVEGAISDISKLKELDLLGKKEKVKRALKDLNMPVVVIIDDIDRLTPEEVYQVVRVIKAVADFPGTAFLLSFDPDYLASALRNYGIENAKAYLDKIIQLRVSIPIVSTKDFQTLANKELENLSGKSLVDNFEHDEERLGYIYHTCIKFLIRNPRELKRIFNNLKFVLLQIEGQVSFTDLYCLSVLAIMFPRIYQSIKSSPEMYIGVNFYSVAGIETPKEIVNKNKLHRDELLNEIQPLDRRHLVDLLGELFPLIKATDSSVFGSNYDQCGRIASVSRLNVALHYQIPTGQVSEREVREFLLGNVNRALYLERSIEEGCVERLFDVVHFHMNNVSYENAAQSLRAIYSVFLNSEYLATYEDQPHVLFGFIPFRSLIWLTNDFLSENDFRKTFIFSLLDSPEFLSVSSSIARRLMQQIGLLESKSSLEELLSTEESREYLSNWCDLVVQELNNESFLDSVHATHIYFVFRLYDPEKIEIIFKRWMNEVSGVEKVAKLICRTGSDSNNGSYCDINHASLEGVLDIAHFKLLAQEQLQKGGNTVIPPLLTEVKSRELSS